ncbi:MAG: MerR family transcriptional regulator, partial [Desulfobacterales bacterium]
MNNADGYFTISELAKEFDVKKSHIRFCEEKGLILPRSSKFNRRVYSAYDHARLKLILHCVLVGYSQEQIVDLIGMPDANLDPNAQVKQGMEYAQKRVKELEHRRNEAKFHERTSIMTELNMMWEYVEAIKTIKLEDVEKPSAKPAIGVKEKAKTAPEPAKAKKTDVEKKSERQPGRMIPVFAAGSALVLIIGGYFFYQSVQKKTPPIELAQTGTHPVYHQPVPSDQTVEEADASSESKETPDRPSPVQQETLKADSTPPVNITSVTGETSSALEKQMVAGTQIKPVPDAKEKETAVIEKPAAKKAAAAPADERLSASAADTKTQKTPEAEVKEAPKPESALIAAPVAGKVSSVPEKQKTGSSQIQPSSKDKAKVRAVEEKPTVKAELLAPAGETLKATAPETKTEKALEVEIKETPKSAPAVRVAAVTGEASSALEKQTVAATETQQATEAKVQKNIIATKPVVEAASPDETGEKLSAVTPENDTAEASEAVSKKVPNESSAKEALAAGAAPTVSQDRTIETPQLGQTSEVKPEETVAWGKPAVEAVPAESGSDEP